MSERLYLSPPYVLGREKELVAEAIDSNWIAPLGPHVEAFESELGQRVGVARALATCSGTASLHLALCVLGVGNRDVVLAPSLTFIGGVSPVLYVGAEPWFVDATASTWNLDPALLDMALKSARAEGRRVGAVISVDLFGQTADYDQIESICGQYNVPLIEDAAEALGATNRNRPAGSFGQLGVLSFNGNKIVTTSGGGALLSDDEELIERAFYLSTQARDPAPHYEHSVVGYNYRMSNLLAAVGRAQLATLEERVAARRRVFDWYRQRLDDIEGLEFMPEAPYGQASRWLTTLEIDPDLVGADRNAVLQTLAAQNIEARPVWKPMHTQPVFAGSRVFGGPMSERIFDRGLCLPSGMGLTEDRVDRVASLVRLALKV